MTIRPIFRFADTGGQPPRGFTLWECLAAVAILASGIVLVYKALLVSLNYQDYLRQRLYAKHLLDSQADYWNCLGRVQKKIPALTRTFTAEVNHRSMKFLLQGNTRPVEHWEALTQIDLRLSWNEHGRNFQLPQTVYVTYVEDRQ